MAKSAILSIRIIADGKQAGREFKDTNDAVQQFEDGLDKMSVGAGVALGALVMLGKGAADAASEVQQATGAVESVYGEQAAAVKAYAEQSAESVGLAESQYLSMSSLIGSQLKNMGVPMAQVADQSNELIDLGADLAATFGGTTADAVAALSSLLRGERDPIERYGVSIKQADVNARIAALGLSGLEGEAARAAETQATLSLLTEQTAAAQGQFARETDTAAGAQQIMTAKWEDAQAALGEALLPMLVQLSTGLSGVADWVGENTELVGVIVGVIATFAGGILALNGAITTYRTIATIATAAQVAWNVAMTANPIGIIIVAIGALVAAIVWLIMNWEEVSRVAGEVWESIVGWITDAIDAIEIFLGLQSSTSRQSGKPQAAVAPAAAAAALTAPAGFAAMTATNTGAGVAAAESWSDWSAPAAAPTSVSGDTYEIDARGSLDPDGTARAIRSAMAGHKTRTGRGGDSKWRR